MPSPSEATSPSSPVAQSRVAQIPYELLAPLLGLIVFLRSDAFDDDYVHYLSLYEEASVASLLFAAEIDLGFEILLVAGQALGLPFDVFLYLLITVSVGAKFFFARHLLGRATHLFVALYCSSFFVLHDLVQIRLAIALSFVYGVIYFLRIRMRTGLAFPAIICGITGVLLHSSILIIGVVGLLTRRVAILALLLIAGLLLGQTGLANLDEWAVILGEQSGLLGKYIRYVYEIVSGETTEIAHYSIHFFLVVSVVVLSALLRIRGHLAAHQRELARSLELLAIVGLAAKILLDHAPVVSFRVFELLTALMPVSQAIVVGALWRRSAILGLVVFACWISANLVVFGRVVAPLREHVLIWL